MKTVVIYSGGMDSTTLLYYFLSQGREVKCLSVNYGQRHRKELQFAVEICKEIGVEHHVADLSSIRPFIAGSSQTSEKVDVPLGHYTDETMKLTVVPNRNMIMISIAVGWAQSLKYDVVGYAAHAGDHAIYPDCRKEFFHALNEGVRLATLWQPVALEAPFLDMSKADICRLGNQLGVPYERTWSCYQGRELHCGRCGTCVERREAFILAGVADPTRYEV
jgi:7-cyano-7-deazaguanine synthase